MSNTLQPHQQRVVDEKAELDGKTGRLNAFIMSAAFKNVDPCERQRLIDQIDIMHAYSVILGERIAAFTPTGDTHALFVKAASDCAKLRAALGAIEQ